MDLNPTPGWQTFWETSVTLWPVTRATVKVESTNGRPNSVFSA